MRRIATAIATATAFAAVTAHAQTAGTAAASSDAPVNVHMALGANPATSQRPPPSTAEAIPAPSPLTPALSKFDVTIGGFVEADFMHDSTQSYSDLSIMTKLARASTYAGSHGRTQFTARDSRFALRLAAPQWAGVRTSALLETDFFGNEGNPGYPPTGYQNTEAGFFNNAVLRVRHAYIKFESDYVDVWAGQMYYLFGNQPYFFPNTDTFLGAPGMLFGRTIQLKALHMFKSRAVNVEIAIAAARPAQRDSEVPDGEAAVRLQVNQWRGPTVRGAGQPGLESLAFGVSALARQFRLNPLANTAPTPTTALNKELGWGIALDALVPVIPATERDRSNAITLTGEIVTGSGVADQYSGLAGDYAWPNVPAAMPGGMPTAYSQANVDGGMVTYDAAGFSHTIDWTSYIVGAQYYLPLANGKLLWISGVYSRTQSRNLGSLVTGATRTTVFDRLDYIDGALWMAFGKAAEAVFSYQNTHQFFLDGGNEVNHRFELTAFYFF